ncbi:MAG: asparaginase [Caldilineaceae bacterium]|jgi:L-asparaginase|nr:asparaginase [Caldilineaceae bacterium]
MRIIATGGTFDKHYDELRGELTFKDSHLPSILKQARLTTPIVLEINQLIDSLHMQEADRQHVLASCRAAPETEIVVIHGTDTMAVTARVLGEAGLAKCIVLTGAMIPYAVQGSDALFNLGFACAAAQLLLHGVYIAMNGEVFAWDKVRKNLQLGVFETYVTGEPDS